ncbi:tRNA dihydrouridine synthase [Alkaliflexus imshenetskii]|uniref:tRNA dihydrouridine synthase n=1 Tax=Alkaliflexus imshenetskii TaxID=286730 RepID=UPI0004ADBE5F|nr:tRNA-dihydrouridine synthase family protein [Alkaliflexus imshenetskii]
MTAISNEKRDINIISSPLQGFTDYRFRNLVNQHFGGIDTFIAPYIRFQGGMEIKKSYKNDLLPSHNEVKNLVPQVMTRDSKELLYVADYVKQLGYKELNWNLGCPYPMVAKRGMGSGLIKDFDKIDSILQTVSGEADLDISVKLRLGYESNQEILKLLPVLNNHKIKYLIIHPRIGKQLYKGDADLEMFEQCMEICDLPIVYNGDIDTVEKFVYLKQRFPHINHWAIGRSVISNPFLAGMIKTGSCQLPEDWTEQFKSFHEALFQSMSESLSGPGHLLIKMQSYWEYFSQMFSDAHKTYKIIRKAKSIDAYQQGVANILKQK